jgi:hypothetical protein
MSEAGVAPNSLEALIYKANQQAMDCLQAEKFPAALRHFKQALGLIKAPKASQLKLIALTYSNIGCYYKRLGQFKTALKYLRGALDLESQTTMEATDLAGTHLNICAILSRLKQHSSAYQHASAALGLLTRQQQSSANAQTLVIALHNAGVELEFLQEFNKATQAYLSGLQVAIKHFGETHPLTERLQMSFLAVRNKIPQSKPRSSSQRTRRTVRPVLDISHDFDRTLPKLNESGLETSLRQRSTEDSRSITRHSNRLKSFDLKKGLIEKPTSRQRGRKNYYSAKAQNILNSRSKRVTMEDLQAAASTIQAWWRNLQRRRLRSAATKRRSQAKSASLPLGQKQRTRISIDLKKRQDLRSKTTSEGGRGTNIKLIKAKLIGFIASRRINEETRAALVIQKSFRMWSCLRIYLCIKDAAIFIQRAFRAYRLRRNVLIADR